MKAMKAMTTMKSTKSMKAERAIELYESYQSYQSTQRYESFESYESCETLEAVKALKTMGGIYDSVYFRQHLFRPKWAAHQLQPGRNGNEPQERARPDREVVRPGTDKGLTRYR
jgi:hypothetical protein